MDLLFKLNEALPVGTKEEVRHYNFKEHYPTLNASMAWNTVKPFIRQVTQEYIIPYLTKDLYDAIATLYTSGSPNAWQLELIEKLQDAIAYYTVYEALPHVNITVSDMGAVQASASDGSANPTNQWSYIQTRWNAIKKADTFMDMSLAQIEEKIEDGESFFDTFKATNTYKGQGSHFFRYTSELNEYLNILGSRRTFLAIAKFLKAVELRELKPILCETTFDALVAGIDGNNLSEANEALLEKVKPVVANYGLVEAIPHLAILVEADGIKFLSQSDMLNDKRNLANVQHFKMIEKLQYKAEDNARTARADLIDFLNNNADDYPDWKTSDCFVDWDSENDTAYPDDHVGGILL